MTTSALIVEDDPKIMDVIEDTLCSFGHDHTWVTNQFDARAALRTQDFRYVLLDLQIPAKPKRGGASKEFGINLLREIRDQRNSEQLPVVIMTAYSSDCLDLTTELIDNGASDFISKPFHDKRRTLAKVIRDVLRKSRASDRKPKPAKVQVFSGGELIFYPTRVELCGVTICGDTKTGRIRRILDELSQRTSRGNFVAYSGDELAAQVGCRVRGQNAISETIRDFRKYVAAVMLAEANLQVGPRDVIQSGGRGYRFADKIVVGAVDDPQNEPVHEPDHFDGDPVTTGLNDRQRWIISELRAGNALKICDVIERFQCSNTTAKRDLTDLRRRKLIAFAGPPRTGVWKLCRES